MQSALAESLSVSNIIKNDSSLSTYFAEQFASLTPMKMVIALLFGLAVGMLIAFVYKKCYRGVLYSPTFSLTLIMLTLITTPVVMCIKSDIALSMGMVGALSIVRFRTAIKDARDTAYIFWAVAAGICCGISDFMIAVLGSVVIFLLMLVLGNIQGNNRYLLIVRGGAAAGEKIEQAVQEVYGGKARLCVKNSARESVEYIYELSQKLLQRTENVDISERLFQMDSVETVDLVSQNDEITS